MHLTYEAIPCAAPVPLSPNEQKTFESLKIKKRSDEWLAGRMAAKRALAQALESLGLNPPLSEIEILNAASGKPQWNWLGASEMPSISLSIAHSQHLAGAAARLGPNLYNKAVGLDIEKIEPRHPAWLEEAFSQEERKAGLSWSEATRRWTQKEAILKFLGIGLNVDLWKVNPPVSGITTQSWQVSGYWVTLAY